MKRRRGLVPADSEMQDIDPKGLDTAFWASVTKEDIYEYLYFLNRECGNKKSSTARRLASLHGFYDYLVNQVNKLEADPTAAIHPPKQDKVLPKYLTASSPWICWKAPSSRATSRSGITAWWYCF
jgi:site-specific recombinase XerD